MRLPADLPRVSAPAPAASEATLSGVELVACQSRWPEAFRVTAEALLAALSGLSVAVEPKGPFIRRVLGAGGP